MDAANNDGKNDKDGRGKRCCAALSSVMCYQALPAPLFVVGLCMVMLLPSSLRVAINC